MKSCSTWRVYAIIDRTAAGSRDLAVLADAAIRGGTDVIQLRDKAASTRALMEEAARLLPLARAAGVPLIINDRVDVAHAVGADGVHLGQDDLPIEAAREILGPGRLIGRSTHSLGQALAAESEGADYIAVGPIFPTPTKPDYGSVGLGLIGDVVRRVQRPVVCIGGIDLQTVTPAIQAGARCVAVVRAICAAPDPEAATRTLAAAFTQFSRATAPPSV